MSLKTYFAVLEEIYNNVVPHWSAGLTLAIIFQFHTSFTKNGSNQR
jgi:hypothetical protein